MSKNVITLIEKSLVDKFNEKIISLTFRAELQRKLPENHMLVEDVLAALTEEMTKNAK